MNKNYQRSIFLFRRDLRLEDNTGLIKALEESKEVIACFIFDPIQMRSHPYRSLSAFRFMMESLEDLQSQLRLRKGHLYLFEGDPAEILEKLFECQPIGAVYVNEDYTPFSQNRDRGIGKVCKSKNVVLHSSHDALLNEPNIVRKDDGSFYAVYSPYTRKAMTYEVAQPVANNSENYFSGNIAFEDQRRLADHKNGQHKRSIFPGGRTEASLILKRMSSHRNYDDIRNYPHSNATSKLSAHNKFGTCSIREVYHSIRKKFGPDHTLIRELYWRDFFTYIGYHFPHVLGKPFHKKYESIRWDNDPKVFELWCKGQTGFPIVDAGMRELEQTGFMQNRVRMITASFLVKDLHIDWQWGERYFAQKLVDYDPLVNNGNWQWVASTGCDAQPYFRIFNPWLQQQKFDPQGDYIKKWVPELKDVPAKDLHEIEKKELRFKGYPTPIIWHEGEKAKALKAYQRN